MRQIKQKSLKVKLVFIIIFCWVLPVLLIGSFCALYYTNAMDHKINQSIRNEVDSSMSFVTDRLELFIHESRAVSYSREIENEYKAYLKSDYAGDFINFQYNTRQVLDSNYDYRGKTLLSAFFLLDRNEPSEIVFSNRSEYDMMLNYHENVHSKVLDYASGLGTKVGFFNDGQDLFLVRNLIQQSNFEPFGVLVYQINPEFLFEHMMNKEIFTDAFFFTFGDSISELQLAQNRFSKQEIEQQRGAIVKNLHSLAPDSVTVEKTDKMICYYSNASSKDYSFSSAILVDKEKLNKEFVTLNIVIYSTLATIIPVIVFVFIFIYRNITNPIQKIITVTQKLKQGELGVQIPSEIQNSEFQNLADSFNNMSSEMKYLFDYVYKEQIALKDAKILAMTSQMNPHFLNNTLEMMNWQARMSGDITVSKMIESLSVLLDASMNRTEEKEIPLSQELECVDAYLYIISMRFGKRLRIEKEIDAVDLDTKIPPLSIQPLLENSVTYGIQPLQKGTVTIKIYQKSLSCLAIEVCNNGKEISKEEEARIKRIIAGEEKREESKHRSLGIYNVNQRIRLLYGEAYGLQIFRDHDGITVARITIPYHGNPAE